jgi:hypothetical protein
MDARREQRFWAKVDRRGSDECWSWLASMANGYGQFFAGSNQRAHRIAFSLLVGPIPSGLELDHLCRNPICVNPAHLEPVSHAENLRRSPTVGRTGKRPKMTHCPKGHPLEGSNLYVRPTGRRGRQCRMCRDTAMAKRQQRLNSIPCRIEGCERGIKARGLCAHHWYRDHKYGSPT